MSVRPRSSPARWLCAAVLGLTPAACTGVVRSPVDDGRSRGVTDPATCTIDGPGATPLRPLSGFEYQRTITDLVGQPFALSPSPGTGTLVYDNDAADLSVSPAVVDSYFTTAASAAAAVRSQLADRLTCDRAEGSACAESFLRDFARRAYRRPIDADELQHIMTLFALGADFDEGIELAVTGILSSPDFTYHVERGRPDPESGAHRLDAYELAARLSFFLLGAGPDAALLDAAERGDLDTEEGVRAQVDRLLDDPRAREAFRHFFAQWLALDRLDGADRDPALGAFDPSVREALKLEVLAFLETLLFDGGTVDQIFDADFTMLNETAAAHYGITGVTGEDPVRVELDERRGILTHAALLAAGAGYDHASPIRRGVFVLQRVLCQELPTPPANIPTLPEPEGSETERERLARHRSDPYCASCHQRFDPLGLVFERYDAVGLPTIEDSGLANNIDTTEDLDGSYADVAEFTARAAHSAEVQRCVTTQMFRYALGRDDDDDACAIAQLHRDLGQDFRLRDLVVAIAMRDAFRLRDAPVIQEGAVCE